MTARSTVGRVSQLDKSTVAKLRAGCNFINAEIARVRGRITVVAAIVALLAFILYGVMWSNGTRDPRFPLFGALI
ncbi:MAG: hypothetical protein ACREOK_14050, partial [Gemmatimonadaceae bacterium]